MRRGSLDGNRAAAQYSSPDTQTLQVIGCNLQLGGLFRALVIE